MTYGKTYKVIDDADGGVINHVKSSDRETESMSLEHRESLRYDRARELLNGWSQNYFRDAQLKIVECR